MKHMSTAWCKEPEIVPLGAIVGGLCSSDPGLKWVAPATLAIGEMCVIGAGQVTNGVRPLAICPSALIGPNQYETGPLGTGLQVCILQIGTDKMCFCWFLAVLKSWSWSKTDAPDSACWTRERLWMIRILSESFLGTRQMRELKPGVNAGVGKFL